MTEYRTSSFCSGADCVQVGFRKSSFCGDGSCVEVAQAPDEVLVRDSKDPGGPVLRFTPAEWVAFVAGVQAGEFGPLP